MLAVPRERRIAALLFFCTAALSAAAVPSDILLRARKEDLAHDLAWLTLLHYAHGLTGSRGLVDDPRFWLSPTGAHDQRSRRGRSHARFPACPAFLAERLGFACAAVPVAGSLGLEALLEGLRARHAWLVFPTGFLSTPASMFGHTLRLIRGATRASCCRSRSTMRRRTRRGNPGCCRSSRVCSAVNRGISASCPSTGRSRSAPISTSATAGSAS